VETLCGQIAINSFSRAKNQTFSRTRYEDLLALFQEYESPKGKELDFFRKQSARVEKVLDELWMCLGERTKQLVNRSYVLSIYLLFEHLHDTLTSDKLKKQFADFVLTLWKRLRQEMGSGMDRRNRELYAFESMISSAPGERYRIEQRHQKLMEYFDHYRKTSRIMGDASN